MPNENEQPTGSHANAQDMLRALKVERAGYEQRGLTDRLNAVDEQIGYWTKVAANSPQNPEAAGEVRESDERANAEKMLTALREEKAGLVGRDGKDKRIAAIDEQITHWTGVVRKSSGVTEAEQPKAAKSASAASKTNR